MLFLYSNRRITGRNIFISRQKLEGPICLTYIYALKLYVIVSISSTIELVQEDGSHLT